MTNKSKRNKFGGSQNPNRTSDSKRYRFIVSEEGKRANEKAPREKLSDLRGKEGKPGKANEPLNGKKASTLIPSEMHLIYKLNETGVFSNRGIDLKQIQRWFRIRYATRRLSYIRHNKGPRRRAQCNIRFDHLLQDAKRSNITRGMMTGPMNKENQLSLKEPKDLMEVRSNDADERRAHLKGVPGYKFIPFYDGDTINSNLLKGGVKLPPGVWKYNGKSVSPDTNAFTFVDNTTDLGVLRYSPIGIGGSKQLSSDDEVSMGLYRQSSIMIDDDCKYDSTYSSPCCIHQNEELTRFCIDAPIHLGPHIHAAFTAPGEYVTLKIQDRQEMYCTTNLPCLVMLENILQSHNPLVRIIVDGAYCSNLDDSYSLDDSTVEFVTIGLGGSNSLSAIIESVVPAITEVVSTFVAVCVNRKVHKFPVDSDITIDEFLSWCKDRHLRIPLLEAAQDKSVTLDFTKLHDGYVVGIGGAKSKIVIKKKKAKPKKIIKIKTVKVVKKKKSNGSVKGSRGFASSYARNGVLAVASNAFSQVAFGQRQDDGYPYPTVPYKLVGTHVINSLNNASSGSFYLSPNPFFAVHDDAFERLGSGNASVIGSSTIYGANPYDRFIVDQQGMASVFSSSRIVGVGWNVRLTMPMQVATGRMFFAPIPDPERVASADIINTFTYAVATDTQVRMTGGVYAIDSSIMQLPGSFEISLADLFEKDLYLRCKPNSARYSDFKLNEPSNIGFGNSFSTSYNIGDVILSGTSAGLISNSAEKDTGSYGVGLNGWLVAFEGTPLPANAVVDIQYIYHLEGIPTLTTASTHVPAPSLINTPKHAMAWTEVMNQLQGMPWASMARGAASFYGKNVGAGSMKALTNF
jgi:hypothetical protein